jgi:transposase
MWRCHLSHLLVQPSFQLTATEVASLRQLIQAHRTPQVMVKRAQIVLGVHAHPDWSSHQLAQSLHLDARLIRKWRRRWFEMHSLQDAPRSGGPRRFSSEVRAQVRALAGSLPRSSGVPLAHRRGVRKVALVLDNGSTHAPKQLPHFVQELASTLDGKLTIQLYWLPPNASWLDQLEIWFRLLQRKLLQPNHFTSRSELEQAIVNFITYYNQSAKPLQWSYTVEQLERKLGTNSR